ncbi:hypothetical protein EDEG_01742 [Edhazardia aedis USNM 41457]|uniref:Uncharacterized protein n=1 Tax=Edhazardia aedis (strain USNM 41457) TaxID=1003232 RepID=J9DN43_EDHAE|nr:hypothetical protein EDEG_01742 [Edhazardia aedis USNM 41457]|eukprot:EJW03975.1 hypothetical protein EDEG_01742 [Edhazardia aedis USNM 41457]
MQQTENEDSNGNLKIDTSNINEKNQNEIHNANELFGFGKKDEKSTSNAVSSTISSLSSIKDNPSYKIKSAAETEDIKSFWTSIPSTKGHDKVLVRVKVVTITESLTTVNQTSTASVDNLKSASGNGILDVFGIRNDSNSKNEGEISVSSQMSVCSGISQSILSSSISTDNLKTISQKNSEESSTKLPSSSVRFALENNKIFDLFDNINSKTQSNSSVMSSTTEFGLLDMFKKDDASNSSEKTEMLSTQPVSSIISSTVPFNLRIGDKKDDEDMKNSLSTISTQSNNGILDLFIEKSTSSSLSSTPSSMLSKSVSVSELFDKQSSSIAIASTIATNKGIFDMFTDDNTTQSVPVDSSTTKSSSKFSDNKEANKSLSDQYEKLTKSLSMELERQSISLSKEMSESLKEKLKSISEKMTITSSSNDNKRFLGIFNGRDNNNTDIRSTSIQVSSTVSLSSILSSPSNSSVISVSSSTEDKGFLGIFNGKDDNSNFNSSPSSMQSSSILSTISASSLSNTISVSTEDKGFLGIFGRFSDKDNENKSANEKNDNSALSSAKSSACSEHSIQMQSASEESNRSVKSVMAQIQSSQQSIENLKSSISKFSASGAIRSSILSSQLSHTQESISKSQSIDKTIAVQSTD